MSFTSHLYQIRIHIHTYIIWNIVFIVVTLLSRHINGHIIYIFLPFLPYFLFFFFINLYLTIASSLTFSPPFHFSTTLNLNVIRPRSLPLPFILALFYLQPHTINLIVSLALYTYFPTQKSLLLSFSFFFFFLFFLVDFFSFFCISTLGW